MNFLYNAEKALEELIDVLVIDNFEPDIDIMVHGYESEDSETHYKVMVQGNNKCIVSYSKKGIYFHEKSTNKNKSKCKTISSDTEWDI